MDPVTIGLLATAVVSLVGSAVAAIGNSSTTKKQVDASKELQTNNLEWSQEQAEKQMDFQTSANKIAMDFSHDEAEIQRNWLENMSNTSYQRAVKDLRAAGLNPILAYSQGGASVPSISSASGVSSAGALANLGDSGQSAVQAMVQGNTNSLNIMNNAVNSAASIANSALKAQSANNNKGSNIYINVDGKKTTVKGG